MGSILFASSSAETKREVVPFLMKRGHRVRAVEKGSEVLLATLDEEPDLVILDLELQELPGLKTIELIKRIRHRIPLIILSDDDSVEMGQRILEKGVFSYLLKPLSLPYFGEMVECALHHPKKEGWAWPRLLQVG
ncbi:MAG: response regulator [candidate division NC10 bacterium]|nr:response regulator [candidate division NC10 bacterium]